MLCLNGDGLTTVNGSKEVPINVEVSSLDMRCLMQSLISSSDGCAYLAEQDGRISAGSDIRYRL